ncbi:hypothetical protein RYH80_08270 [Halobaculum sp. MBLA0147]|uniref:hypothetical protein n=1 Tax=Halobaculum sp. MBLA0147 TaxID=3079934 RepID=UPI0035254585
MQIQTDGTRSETGAASRRTDRPPVATRGDSRRLGPSPETLLGSHADDRRTADASPVVGDLDAEPPTAELPELDAEIYRLDPDAETPRERRRDVLTALDTLAVDTALDEGGDVVWIDAQGYATTQTLVRVAPTDRVLDRVHVARAFTAHQHHTLVAQLARWVDDGATSPFGGPATERLAVVVAPALDALYRASDRPEAACRRLFVRAVALLRRVVRALDVPVLTTRARPTTFSEPLAAASTRIGVERTPFGPRFHGDEVAFETLAYPGADGTVQTTLAFWRELLRARHATVTESDPTRASPGSPASPRTPTPGAGW